MSKTIRMPDFQGKETMGPSKYRASCGMTSE